MVKAAALGKSATTSGRKRSPLQPSVATVPGSEAEELREYLREWRRAMAKEQNVPAYIVLHDSSLEEICRVRPKSVEELLEIPGIGERKAEVYGRPLLDALEKYRQGERASASERKVKPADETLRLLSEGKSLQEIADARGRQLSTIVSGVATLLEMGELEFRSEWVSKEKQSVIEAACARVGIERLKPVKDILPQEITYDEVRLVVARLRREEALKKTDVPA
jgi:ATP-dependent DNA helicase RecQ